LAWKGGWSSHGPTSVSTFQYRWLDKKFLTLTKIDPGGSPLGNPMLTGAEKGATPREQLKKKHTNSGRGSVMEVLSKRNN